jgi:hypothetical protein
MTRIKIICSHYESGYGHGVKNDGFDLSKTPYSDPELGEAYQYGYQCGNNEYHATISDQIERSFVNNGDE